MSHVDLAIYVLFVLVVGAGVFVLERKRGER
jgi:hypothetical protein